MSFVDRGVDTILFPIYDVNNCYLFLLYITFKLNISVRCIEMRESILTLI